MKKFLSLLLSLLLLFGVSMPAVAEELPPFYTSQVLQVWCDVHNMCIEQVVMPNVDVPIDVAVANAIIRTAGNEIVYSYSGVPTIHGGAISENETVTLGIGTGLEGYEKYWYTSLKYSPEVSEDTFMWTSYAFLLTSMVVFIEDEAAGAKFEEEWAGKLLTSDNIAVEINDVVFIGKELPGGIRILAVDSVDYYNEFYYNDTENYFVLD